MHVRHCVPSSDGIATCWRIKYYVNARAFAACNYGDVISRNKNMDICDKVISKLCRLCFRGFLA